MQQNGTTHDTIVFSSTRTDADLAGVRVAVTGGTSGLGLALACDFRLAADDAVLTSGFAKLGLFADWGVSYFLPQRVGSARAIELALGSERFAAPAALSAGLVDAVVPAADHERAWRDKARRWADVPKSARDGLVQALRRVDRAELEATLDREKAAQLARFRSPEVRAKVAEFVRNRSRRAGS